ncbi:nucleotidyltransferase domain-containing protein [Candidatus Gracilibacteria bacterium]|nr:nucleotidyltransferase domain-containing protein [Candidatus Gracilibacteria bacterium]NJM86220.1 nucleotidyltransferase domain-containing protein [Hydrococcus sp. RU_2_2]NJP17724.1 nucleotidyltransferase domain-containing protein [Hydrococcus sp. CRU_1_1]NJQ97071.1 nucleotidyltransferase domain-containing protein [Hydrococcus sp. CSU_1_8]
MTQKLQLEKVNTIIAEVIRWASYCNNISAIALVGSWARGTARTDSDIDLMFLTPDPSYFKSDRAWIDEIDWKSFGCDVVAWEDKDYGLVWSCHIYLTDETEIEFSFGHFSWASVNPIDAGTLSVVSNGCRILYDPEGLLSQLLKYI